MSAAHQPHTVLITGSSGFTGRHLVHYLRATGATVRTVGFDLRAAADLPLDGQIVGDLAARDELSRALRTVRPDAIVHLAGRMPPATDAELRAANVDATRNLLDAITEADLTPRVLVIGSAAEYGPTSAQRISERHSCNPTTPYGRTKLAQTQLCRQYAVEHGVPIMIARPFNLFGPGMPPQTVIGEICSQLARAGGREPLRLGNLASARDFIDIRAAVSAHWAILTRGEPGEVYNVCTGHATRIQEIADILVELAGAAHSVESRTERFQAGDVAYSCGDPSKLTQQTGATVVFDLRSALRDTLASFVERAHSAAG